MFGFIGGETKNGSNSLLLDAPHTGTVKYVWAKPADCKFLYVMLVGGGGAGGEGHLAAGVAGGGGGGGSGAITNFLIPGVFVPKFLYFRVGAGGATSAAAGTATLVSMIEDTVTFTDSEVIAYAEAGSGGVSATTGSGGAGGAGGAIFAPAARASRLLQTGGYFASAGRAGFTGGGSSSGTAPVNVTSLAIYPHYIMPGMGGSGWNGTFVFGNGGAYDFSTELNHDYGAFPLIGGNNATGLRNGNSGFLDRTRSRAFMAFGGAGGSASNAGTGGGGGNGVFGSGGGGGGSASGQRGPGGRGGDGAALIVWW